MATLLIAAHIAKDVARGLVPRPSLPCGGQAPRYVSLSR